MKQVSNFQRKLISRGNPVKQHFPKLSLSRPIPSTQAAQHAWAGKQPLKALWQARRGSWHLQSTLSTSELGWAEIRASPLSSGCAVTVHPCYNQAKSKQNLLFEIWDDFSVLYTANQSHGTRTLHSRDSLALPNASWQKPRALSTFVPFPWFFPGFPEHLQWHIRQSAWPEELHSYVWFKPVVLHPIPLFLWCFFQLAKKALPPLAKNDLFSVDITTSHWSKTDYLWF